MVGRGTWGAGWRLAGDLCREAGGVVRRNRRAFLLAGGVVVAVMLALLPFDRVLVARAQAVAPEGGTAWEYARWVSRWGQYEMAAGLTLLGLAVAARVRRSRAWGVAALAVLLATGPVSLGVNIIKPLTGRPRPASGVADGLYGPSLRYDFHSFPSGHATTNVALAAVVTVLAPPAGLVYVPFAVEACRGRLTLGRHNPTDVLAGAALGLASGLAFGCAGRILRRRGENEQAGV